MLCIMLGEITGCRTVLDWLAEDLQQVSVLIMIEQNLVLLKHVDVLSQFDCHFGQVLSDNVIVGVRNGQELDSSFHQGSHSFNNSFSPQGDVLRSRAVIIVHKLLDLGFLLGYCRLSDGYLDVLMVVSHDDGPKG